MESWLSRTELLLGSKAVDKLKTKKIAVFGIGGVGGYCIESLARLGIGSFLLIDNDVVTKSNINRQIIALHSTVGKKKTEVMKDRILDINPTAVVETLDLFVLPQSISQIDLSKYDCIIDAIDTISTKIALAEHCFNNNLPLISCMGAGNRLNPQFEYADIFKTKNCPLAKIIRRELKKRNIPSLGVVYSLEEPKVPQIKDNIDGSTKKIPIGSVSFVPPSAGLMLASCALKLVMD